MDQRSKHPCFRNFAFIDKAQLSKRTNGKERVRSKGKWHISFESIRQKFDERNSSSKWEPRIWSTKPLGVCKTYFWSLCRAALLVKPLWAHLWTKKGLLRVISTAFKVWIRIFFKGKCGGSESSCKNLFWYKKQSFSCVYLKRIHMMNW